MPLRFDPLVAFTVGETPIALHVRRRYGKAAPGDDALAARQRRAILANQGADGLWDACAGRTINALFGLWLLQQPPGPQTLRGVNALLEAHHPLPPESRHAEGFDLLAYHVRRSELARLADVPFTQGCSLFVKTGAALFFAAKFGQGDHARIAAARSVFDARAKAPARRGRWCSGPCANNVVQAYAASAELAAGSAMQLATGFLASQQGDHGAWGAGIPFFPTLFALAQVPGEAAEAQLLRAAKRLMRTQNRDGTWGRARPQACTFMVLDALARVGLLRAAVA